MAKIIEKLLTWIASIPKDKLLHDFAGLLIAMFSFAILFRFKCPVRLCFVLADIIAVAALALKELYDAHNKDKHSVELADFFWGLFGVVKFNIAALIMFV